MSADLVTLDGSQGEGGGQILRTALALALVTGRGCRIHHIRARRQKPGLLAQHLTAVRAAAQISRADLRGAALGSRDLLFLPGPVAPGDYRFAVGLPAPARQAGTAGSATLVLQTVLPALLMADAPSHLTLEGGTHNPAAPPFEFLDRTFLPLLRPADGAACLPLRRRQAPGVRARLLRHGFFPAGGGQLSVEIAPVGRLAPLELLDRGPLTGRRVRALVARLPLHIAQREVREVCRRLGWSERDAEIAEVHDSAGPGNVVFIELASASLTEVFTGFGQRGVPAEAVAAAAADQAQAYLQADVPVGPHLADQLLLPLALAGRGRFRTLPLSTHALTNIDVIRRFLDVTITAAPRAGPVWEVRIGS